MTRLQALTAILQAEVALDQWDAPPSVGLLAEGGEEFRLVPVQLSQSFWELDDPPALLFILAAAIEHPDRMAGGLALPVDWPEGFVLAGAALFTEGWGLDLNGMDKQQAQEARDLAAEHELHQHPNRIEVKIIGAVDVDGARYATHYKRGAAEPTPWQEDGEGTQLAGRVFDGLTEMLGALQRTGELGKGN